jgi:cohesin loading factor subunit SCC2
LSAVTWGQELSSALQRCNSLLNNMHDEADEYLDHGTIKKLADGVKAALHNVWQEAAHDVFDIGYA